MQNEIEAILVQRNQAVEVTSEVELLISQVQLRIKMKILNTHHLLRGRMYGSPNRVALQKSVICDEIEDALEIPRHENLVVCDEPGLRMRM
jgi:hypothetical protein